MGNLGAAVVVNTVMGNKNIFWGYVAGIVAGLTYGLNPLFAKPLLEMGVSVDTMLSIRYLLAVAILGAWLLFKKESFKVNKAQFLRLCILGVLFGLSSMLLFVSYKYIPAGLATTIVFLYPVLVALIMVFLKVYPTWQVWLSILMTFVGVVILCKPSGSLSLNMTGLLLAGASALFYALLTGSLLFIVHNAFCGGGFLSGVHGWFCWANLAGLAIFPTLVSLLTLAIATRVIGATKTSVLGVFEPVTAIAVGTIFFGESLTVNVIVGVAITLVAVTFMVVTAKK